MPEALYLYPYAESNRNRQNRNLKFYPLNYRGKTAANIGIFTEFANFFYFSTHLFKIFG